MTQTEVYQLFGAIDRQPGIMEPKLGRWHAWPIVKLPFVWQLMQDDALDKPRGAVWRWSKLKERLPRLFTDIVIAARQTRQICMAPDKGAVGMIYLPRLHRLADGRTQDFILGDLLRGEGLSRPSVALEQPWPGGGSHDSASKSAIDLSPYHSLAEVLAIILMASPRLRRVADELDAQLSHAGLQIDAKARSRTVLLALCLFEAKRRIFRRLARRLHLRALVVTYGPGRFAEIAAARELGLPVVELQHGVIGAHCPDYAWPSEYVQFRQNLPLPDRIAVFGEMFRELILHSGFWKGSEILSVGAAAMESFRRDARQPVRVPGPLKLLFMTQSTSRRAATSFWLDVAASAEFKSSGLTVALKVHPEEQRDPTAYRELLEVAPGRFDIVPSDTSPIDAMLASDVVVSYNSMALVESLGVGVPAVSLCGGSIPAGFAGSFDLDNIVGVMPHVGSPDELFAVLRERAVDAQKLSKWRSETQAEGRHFFADGFTAAAQTMINELLALPPRQAQRGT